MQARSRASSGSLGDLAPQPIYKGHTRRPASPQPGANCRILLMSGLLNLYHRPRRLGVGMHEGPFEVVEGL